MSKKNNKKNVSVAKPKAGGAVYLAPEGTEVPTDALSELPEAYACLGCISEDGVGNQQDSDSTDFEDWEGQVVESANTSYAETLTMTFIEAVNVDVLRFVYGDENVLVNEKTGGIHVRHAGRNDAEGVMVVDTILKGNRLNRLVVPRAKLTDVEEITRKRSELIGYDSTVKALSDDDGVCVHEYIDEAKASKPVDPEPPTEGGDEPDEVIE